MPRTRPAGCAASRALLASTPTALRASSRMRFSKWHGLGNDYLLVERGGGQGRGGVGVGGREPIDGGGGGVEFPPVSVGNPRAVPRRHPDRAELLRLGPLVEHHERFPERTNVQLVQVDGKNDITVGVWERGAGETLSSGTSAVAASAAAVANGWCESPVTVHLAGGDLHVELADGRATLTGPAEEICTVELAEEFQL